MKVVLTIDGREAVPVRAIPMLSNWHVFTPDEIAYLASCHETYMGRYALNTYRKTDGVTRLIPASWWDSYVVKKLLAISEKIKLEQLGDNNGYLQWRNESLEALPPGTFVWRDELEVLHQRKFGPEGEVVGWESAEGEMSSEEVGRRFQTLDFEPFVPGEWQALLMAGFDPVCDPTSSPLVEASSSRPLQRRPAQEAAILSAIQSAGHRADALPASKKGRRGVKADIWDALKNDPLFVSRKVFDSAWERLRKQELVKETASH